ncbi:MAG: SUMF1/EgtB/PvdO family nonheme iron enzyme [Paludibacteraceae bacterium]
MKKHIILTLFFIGWLGIKAQIPDADMIQVTGSSFLMGNGTYTRESPTRVVAISTFYMSKNVVTNVQFATFLNAYGSTTVLEGDNAGKPLFKEDLWGIVKNNNSWQPATGYENFPAIKITWYGANAYCKWAGGRLPTEAEWEYAAKGGINKNTYTYSGSSTASTVAWFYDNSGHINHQIGTKTANSIGLFDMSGNVYEWCSDWFGRYGDILTATTDPVGPDKGVSKVIRGGYRSLGSTDLHLTHRESISPDECYNFVGFRLVKTSLTSVEQLKDNEVRIFPNPAKNYIHIETKGTIKSIEIINSTGSVVNTSYGNVNVLAVDNLTNGTYIVKLKNTFDEYFITKLMIEK